MEVSGQEQRRARDHKNDDELLMFGDRHPELQVIPEAKHPFHPRKRRPARNSAQSTLIRCSRLRLANEVFIVVDMEGEFERAWENDTSLILKCVVDHVW